MKENDLSKRLFKFSVDSIKLLRTLKGGNEIKIISNQLGKSATSSGANYEESQAAISRADFKNKVSISLKEMRESNYWLRIFNTLEVGDKKIVGYLVKESLELKNILGSITSKIK